MSCPGNTVLHFERSGVKIRAYEMDIKSEYGKFDIISARVSLQAADVVADKYFPGEPVSVYAGDSKVARGVLPADEPIDHRSEFGDLETAYITLLDQRTVLQTGVVDDWYSNESVGEMLRDIIDRRKDPFGVIRKVTMDSFGDADEVPDTYRFRDGTDSGIIDGIINAAQRAWEWASVKSDELIDGTGGIFTGFSFDDGVTPWEAIDEIQKAFSFELYIDHDGVLHIGLIEARPEVFVVGPKPGMISLTSYAVPEQYSPLKTVTVIGARVRATDDNSRGAKTYRAHARATRTDITSPRYDTEVIDLDGGNRTGNGDRLQTTAASYLSSLVTLRKQGSVTVNPMTGNDAAGDLTNVGIGQTVIIMPYDHCKERNIVGGQFTITGYRHQFNSTDGWAVTLDVSHNSLTEDNVETEFFLIDPYTGEEIDPEDVYIVPEEVHR